MDDLVKRTIDPCKAALKDAGISSNEIDEVVLVGGMTRMPKIIQTVKEFFGKDPIKELILTKLWVLELPFKVRCYQGM